MPTVAKMIAVEALYQTVITLTLHFIGPKALRPIDKHVSKVEFKLVVSVHCTQFVR